MINRETLLGFIGTALAGLFGSYIFINLVLGCETYDKSYWTESNSCLTPAMILGLDG